MNNKLIYSLVFFVLFVTGCSVTYNVEIYNSEVREEFEIFNMNSSDWDVTYDVGDEDIGPSEYDDSVSKTYRQLIEEDLDSNTPAFIGRGEVYYKKELISAENLLGIKYSYNYDINEYSDSTLANECFKYFNVLDENKKYIISTSQGAKCLDNYENLNNITIHLKTNHKVITNNADRVEGYNYYWDINKSNSSIKSIYIELSKYDYVFNYEDRITKALIVTVSVAILIFIVIIFLRKRDKRNNEI